MKRATTLLLVAGLLAGCNVPGLLPGAKPPATVANQPVEPLGGIQFKPVSASNARLLNGGVTAPSAATGGAERSAAPATDSTVGVSVGAPAPVAAPAPMPGGTKSAGSGGGAFSGNVNGYYGYGYGYYGGYGGGGSEPTALVSITEAEAPGASGSFQEVIKKVVSPVIKAWASDGRLIQSSATLGNDGGAYRDPNAPAIKPGSASSMYYGDAPGWRLVYLAPSRQELLHFYVTPDKTLILRQRWAPLNLDPEAIRIDSASAIKALVSAIETKGSQSEEEKTGKDYFLGTAFEAANTPDMYGGGRTEVMYDVPDNARWNVQLQATLGKLVWVLNYYAPDVGVAYPVGPAEAVAGGTAGADAVMVDKAGFSVMQEMIARPMPMPVPGPNVDPGYWTNNTASGMVDAQSGTVIRFSRPYRHYYREDGQTLPPKPELSPLPEPAKSPEATTTVSSGSSGTTP